MSATLDRPVFVVGSPRTGTTLLQHCLSRDPRVFRLERESRFLWHRMRATEKTGRFPPREEIEAAYLGDLFTDPRPMTPPDLRRWVARASSQGTPASYWDISSDLRRQIEQSEDNPMTGPFARAQQDETAPFCIPPQECLWASDVTGPIRMVDKDTGHCWRLPQLAATFPDAVFLFTLRDPAAAVTSLVNAWLHPHWFFTYYVSDPLRIGGYSDRFPWGEHWWNVNLFPGWRDFTDSPLGVLCARQWESAVLAMMEDGLPLVASGRARFVDYDALVRDPQRVLTDVAAFADLDVAAVAGPGLGKVYMTMDPSARVVTPTSDVVTQGLTEVRGTITRLTRFRGPGGTQQAQ